MTQRCKTAVLAFTKDHGLTGGVAGQHYSAEQQNRRKPRLQSAIIVAMERGRWLNKEAVHATIFWLIFCFTRGCGSIRARYFRKPRTVVGANRQTPDPEFRM